MSRLAFGGGESRVRRSDGLTYDTGFGDLQIVVGGAARSGDAAYRANTLGAYLNFVFGATADRTFYARAWVMVTSAPPSQNGLLAFYNSATLLAQITLGTDLKFRHGAGESAAISLNTWYCLELSAFQTGASGIATDSRVNGASLGSQTGAVMPPAAISFGTSVRLTTATAWGGTAYFDDWALNDDLGASNNSWTGDDESVLELRPTSDTAAGGWVRGNGAGFGGEGYKSLDNNPPRGKNYSAESTIRCQNGSASAANDSKFQCPSYAAAGVTGTVIAAKARSWMGDDGFAGEFAVATRIAANPADPTENVINAGNAGNPFSDISWREILGVIQELPTVTLADPVTLQIGRRSTTGAAMHANYGGVSIAVEPSVPITSFHKLRASGSFIAKPVRVKDSGVMLEKPVKVNVGGEFV